MSWFRKTEKVPARVRCIDVVQAYGAILEAEPYGAGGTIAEEKLPYDKPLIKAALVDAATTTGVPESQVMLLKVGFLELAAFRVDGGGKSPLWNSSKDLPKTRAEIAEFLRDFGDSKESELAASVADEMSTLAEEWKLRVQISKVVDHA